MANVAAVIASMKVSSPGHNCLCLTTLQAIPVEVIAILFNLLLLKGLLPTRGKDGNIFISLVTFIKKVKVPGNPLEFCPIGNYFVQVFHRVPASHLRASLPNHQDQVRLIHLDGIAHNVLKLNAALHPARAKHENLAVTRKAFDCLPKLLMGYLRSYFSMSRLQIGNDLIHPKYSRVKQGDPLSLWLSNLALNQIPKGQEEYAFTISAIVLNQMAYADDVILFGSSPEEMQKRLDRLAVSLGHIGLELNALILYTLYLMRQEEIQLLTQMYQSRSSVLACQL
ncbi:unnamed protein product [Acanthosepion pharaonis]|uniref:Reverse transcriptase domain-containing protein n=1 Tax=Acanthosepion pharaonis TaxID=158019 RepID=A0A812D0X2_ACAPH|nr:unnamed protein product [Sepia pharaonis]